MDSKRGKETESEEADKAPRHLPASSVAHFGDARLSFVGGALVRAVVHGVRPVPQPFYHVTAVVISAVAVLFVWQFAIHSCASVWGLTRSDPVTLAL
ncbi:hypothetical protein Pelo_4250 [Pelomyxa schiedti]|nr:hypothetical protein Pelo_4250 [Pelomyxa schiedti]